MMTDPISDMLARIKNACQRSFETVDIPSSKIKAGILNLIETSQDSETELPQFKVEINKNYADFDLYRFNEDYKAGMNAFEMKK